MRSGANNRGVRDNHTTAKCLRRWPRYIPTATGRGGVHSHHFIYSAMQMRMVTTPS